MKVKIRTKGFRCTLPLPLSAMGFAVRLIPNRVFERMREGTPEDYRELVSRETVRLLVGECLGALKEHRGLELVHVEAADGTLVSVKL